MYIHIHVCIRPPARVYRVYTRPLLALQPAPLTPPTPYSKFAGTSPRSIPSRAGMLCIYAPALCTAGYCAATASAVNGRELLVSFMLLIHFGKRVMETLAVHSYSGSLDAAAGGFRVS